jgi:hypothetical protein
MDGCKSKSSSIFSEGPCDPGVHLASELLIRSAGLARAHEGHSWKAGFTVLVRSLQTARELEGDELLEFAACRRRGGSRPGVAVGIHEREVDGGENTRSMSVGESPREVGSEHRQTAAATTALLQTPSLGVMRWEISGAETERNGSGRGEARWDGVCESSWTRVWESSRFSFFPVDGTGSNHACMWKKTKR